MSIHIFMALKDIGTLLRVENVLIRFFTRKLLAKLKARARDVIYHIDGQVIEIKRTLRKLADPRCSMLFIVSYSDDLVAIVVKFKLLCRR